MAITKLMSIKSRPGAAPAKGLSNALKYITNPEQTDNGKWVRSYNTFTDWKGAYDDMMCTKKLWQQEDGMQ